MEWLNGLFGEKIAQTISFLALFTIILVVIYILYMIIKNLSGKSYTKGERNRAPRLTVTDAAAIDSRRRIVLIRRDNVEHLILIGGPSDLVIEQNIVTDLANQPVPDAQPAFAMPASQHEEHASSWTEIKAEPSQPAFAESDESFELTEVVQATTTSVSQQAPLPTEPQPEQTSTSQHQLQTHAQQVAAAQRQLQAQQQRSAQPTRTIPSRIQEEQNQAPKLHPAYPLGQVARGVVAATSGLAAANNAAQQELIAAAKLGQGRAQAPASSVNAAAALKISPQQPNIAPALNQTPAARPKTQDTLREAPTFDLNLELENAVAAALSSENLSFEEMLSSEMDLQFNSAPTLDKAITRKDQVSTAQSGFLDIPARK